MKLKIFYRTLFLAFILILHSCENEEISEITNEVVSEESQIPEHIKEKLEKLGFVVDNDTKAFEDGYAVEGDIFLTEEGMDKMLANTSKKGAASTGKHYLANFYTRANIGAGANVTTYEYYIDANTIKTRGVDYVNSGFKRFNDLHLMINFRRTFSRNSADIEVNATLNDGDNAITTPNTGGAKSIGSLIRMDQTQYGKRFPSSQMVDVVAHEIGHAIGFRHVDYANRASCNQGYQNEGTGDGAIEVAGTLNSTIKSWMSACFVQYSSNPFTLEDKIALYNTFGRHRDAGDLLISYKGKNGNSSNYQTDYNTLYTNTSFEENNIMGRVYSSRGSGQNYLYLRKKQINSSGAYDYILTTHLDNAYETVAHLGYIAYAKNNTNIALYRYTRNGLSRYSTDVVDRWTLPSQGWIPRGVIGYLSKK